MKRFLIVPMLIFLYRPFLSADVNSNRATVSLSQVLDLAEQQNPDIIALRQSWKVSQALVTPTKAWPNPTFTYVNEKLPGAMDGTPVVKVNHYRVEQMIPFPGKLSGDARMKYHETLIAEANYRSKLIEVRGDVRMRYYQMYLTDQKISLAHQSVETFKSLLKTAQLRLASGQSTTSDVFMAQIELRKMENMLYEQEQERVLIQIELNSLLNQKTDIAWASTEAPELQDLPVALTDFQSLAEENDPQYWAAMHEKNHAKAMLTRNRLEFLPDFNVMYEREAASMGADGRQVGVGISFPLWFTRPWGAHTSSQEHLLETEALSQSMKNMVTKMVHSEYTEAVTHLALARNYETTILPTAQSNLKIAREQYASGRGDFLRILEAFRTWTDAHNEYQDHLYHFGEHWSLLERWVGVDLSKAKEILAKQSSESKENHHAH